MSPRELSMLRDLVARTRLAAEAARRREDEETRWPRLGPWCVYCGRRVSGRSVLACQEHRDLLAVDPKYADVTFDRFGRAA